MFDLVKTLTELVGPSGYEEPVQQWLYERWKDLGLEVHRTPIGNVLGRLGGHGPRLLIGAHADEISFRVKSIDPLGCLWLTTGRGGAEQRPPEPVPLGHVANVVVDGGIVEGTFVTVTGHILTRQQRAHRETHGLEWMDFYVDAGLRSRAEAEEVGIHPGCPVINSVLTRRVGHNLVGKAMDDRAGLAVMTMMAEHVVPAELQYEVWLASTIAEECGLTGARSAIAGFDLGVVVEVGLAGDIPLVDPREMPVALGAGPIIVHKDMRVHYSRQVIAALVRCAQTRGIPIQHATFQNYSGDAAEWLGEGVPTGMVAFPCRHTHSPHETVRESDLKAMAQLLVTFVTSTPTVLSGSETR